MKPVLAAGAAAAALLLLLAGIFLRGAQVGARPYDAALAALHDIEDAAGTLERDILSARAGLLRDYDPLVHDVRLLRDAVDRLRASAVDGAATDRLAAWLDGQEEILERFKSDNALLRNSLAQFALLSVRLAAPGGGAPAVPDAGKLASAVLRLTLDTSAASRAEVASRLDGLAASSPPPGTAAPVAALLAHGRILRETLPSTDGALRALLAGPGRPELEAIRAAVLARRDAAERSARRFRVLPYAASVLLLGLLVHLGLQLRARVLALRRRAEFEHLVADVSTGFISSEPTEIEARVEEALARVAQRVGADRAYLVFAGASPQAYEWSADEVVRLPGWPTRVLALSARLEPPGEQAFCLADTGGILSGGERSAFASAGVRAWMAAVKTTAGGEPAALLGCDFVRRGRDPDPGDLGPLRTVLGAVSNLVERAGLEGERARMEARLQQARRLEAVGALASGVAHNFNNVLGAMLGYAEMAEAASDGRSADAFADHRRAAERARDLVGQILAFGRRREPVRRRLGVRALIEESASLVRASLPPGSRLVTGEIPEGAVVHGDRAQLQQVVVNICRNAADAMDGGAVSIAVEERSVRRARAAGHGELKPGRYVAIAISDTGRGMDEATIRRIFEPFFTTRRSGNGLGLATARETVLEHGGAIEVRSEPGAGSRFEVWLPRAAADDAAEEAASSDSRFGCGETVLLLGDGAGQLAKDEELLAALGYEPVGFATTRDALAARRAAPGRFDAAVLCRPEPVAALGLATALNGGGGPRLPVVLAVASAEGIDAKALAASGVDEVVRWPLVGAELAPALRRCVHASSRPRQAGALRL